MFARVSTYTGQASTERIEEGIRRARENVLPRVSEVDGFEGAYLLVDRDSGKALSITLWESEEAMRASEEAAKTLRDEVATGLGTQMVNVERYEVAINPQEGG